MPENLVFELGVTTLSNSLLCLGVVQGVQTSGVIFSFSESVTPGSELCEAGRVRKAGRVCQPHLNIKNKGRYP